ncbi:hypothetical protein N7447_004117 [Penicillium robsamsonii]|uniref:uncharacterized protein n=1 Tax=Penicillium robsamsonii TaxID=1792511 RepID=UPI002547EC41|nr:uncharacterized protein N7447_004117 [Penicillium robsamsonii]KAJ5827354.1 hypothetical protein N7447_004117 [Penicillium robsamsonii]
MAFWVDWVLWEKLSVVLAMLIGLVLLYAFCVLGWNRWMMRKYAAAEAKEPEEEPEMYLMLHNDDIPFGARALERGIEVEGIWVSDPNTPIQSPYQPATPVGSRPVSPAPRSLHSTVDPPRFSMASQKSMISPQPIPPAARRAVASELDLASAGFTYENHRSGALYSRANLSSPNAIPMSPAREEALIGMDDTTGGKCASLPTGIFRTTSHPDTEDYRVGLDGADEDTDHVPVLSLSFSGLSSETKRSSRSLKRPRRRSSEEFRRRMSQIFNDSIHMGLSSEQLEFNPSLRQHQGRLRKSLLRPFRPWANPPGNK